MNGRGFAMLAQMMAPVTDDQETALAKAREKYSGDSHAFEVLVTSALRWTRNSLDHVKGLHRESQLRKSGNRSEQSTRNRTHQTDRACALKQLSETFDGGRTFDPVTRPLYQHPGAATISILVKADDHQEGDKIPCMPRYWRKVDVETIENGVVKKRKFFEIEDGTSSG